MLLSTIFWLKIIMVQKNLIQIWVGYFFWPKKMLVGIFLTQTKFGRNFILTNKIWVRIFLLKKIWVGNFFTKKNVGQSFF